jgi:head-tail adaptor
MRAGRLDRHITIQRKSSSYSDTGEPIDTWSALAADKPASVSPVRGEERFSGEQYIARQQTEFRVRWSSDLADLTPLDRIIYPSADAGDPPTASIYDVMAVHEIGRREGLQIITARQTDR